MLICLLACYLVWHLRKAWAPLTFTDETPPQRDNPVAPANVPPPPIPRPPASTPRRHPLRSFRGLLDHLATLTRDRIRYHHTNIEIDKLTDPTPDQRRAFDLIDSPIPLTIAA
ncbi:transposase domain protein [Mycobacterium xenopi 4042]|uniref:Transposase domain protein n=1 Tax=Mycobacterium xenopi 4042 TaxID=1299334 RepID=X8DLV6_MYCXE|nr:transposase domain protein [Mycobacterium xenopi 4042]